MRSLLSVTALFEALTGLILLTFPSFFVYNLLGVTLSDEVGFVISRIAGAALLTLAAVCWSSRNNDAQRSVKTMLLYHVLATVILLHYSLTAGDAGILLWPAILAHAGLIGWSLFSILKKSDS
jgi:hypothetical protein